MPVALRSEPWTVFLSLSVPWQTFGCLRCVPGTELGAEAPGARNPISLNGAPGWLSRLSVQLLVLAQVVISWFVSSNPTSGSVLTVRSLLGILSPSLSLCPSYTLCLLLTINKLKFKKKCSVWWGSCICEGRIKMQKLRIMPPMGVETWIHSFPPSVMHHKE